MGIEHVNAKTLKKWIHQGEALIIDVREPAEHSAQNISGAHSIPLGVISGKNLPSASNKKLVIHCMSGRRSEMACQKLLSENPALKLYNLTGGINAWLAEGHEVSGSGKRVLPLDRQVQLTIGLAIVTASALTHWVNPNFVWLTAFFGAGLTFAGISGFCGLARVIAICPWNQQRGKNH